EAAGVHGLDAAAAELAEHRRAAGRHVLQAVVRDDGAAGNTAGQNLGAFFAERVAGKDIAAHRGAAVDDLRAGRGNRGAAVDTAHELDATALDGAGAGNATAVDVLRAGELDEGADRHAAAGDGLHAAADHRLASNA